MSRFAFVVAERGNHAVATLCRIIGASVSGFYAWLRAVPSVQARAEAEAGLRGHIGRIFSARRRAYGSPRVHAEPRREAGSTHDVSLDQPGHVGVVPRGLLALAPQAGIAGLIGAGEVEGDPAQARQVARGPALADAAVILAEDDVQNPV